MKELLTAMFVALLLAGCGEEIPTTGKEAKNGNLREVNINMISERNGSYFFAEGNERFTGVVHDKDKAGHVVRELTYNIFFSCFCLLRSQSRFQVPGSPVCLPFPACEVLGRDTS